MLDPESRMAAIPGSRKIPAVRQTTPMRSLRQPGQFAFRESQIDVRAIDEVLSGPQNGSVRRAGRGALASPRGRRKEDRERKEHGDLT